MASFYLENKMETFVGMVSRRWRPNKKDFLFLEKYPERFT
jgi:hypothetical protein